MVWPQLDDYRTAIQNPSMCFDDPGLKNGKVIPDKLGLPKVSSGNFACVYEVREGRERWAVRVFNKEVTDQQVRYDQISDHLAAVLPPYMVNFEFIKKGILVRGHWYPIVKMEWAEGVPLTDWVWDNMLKPKVLKQMAAKWRAMVGGLRGLDVSHSDLQQGNVLINASSDIKLVDYDCMYVPDMQGQRSPELGHPNWNHAQRSVDTFDSNLDQFPGLVGYLSLLAVAETPGLMNKYCNDDNIIFIKSDFVDPDQSPVLKELRKSSNPNIKKLAVDLTDWCKQSVNYTTLEAVCCGAPPPPRQTGAKKGGGTKSQTGGKASTAGGKQPSGGKTGKTGSQAVKSWKWLQEKPFVRLILPILFIGVVSTGVVLIPKLTKHSSGKTVANQDVELRQAMEAVDLEPLELRKLDQAAAVFEKYENTPLGKEGLKRAAEKYLSMVEGEPNDDDKRLRLEAALKYDRGDHREEIQQKLKELGSPAQ